MYKPASEVQRSSDTNSRQILVESCACVPDRCVASTACIHMPRQIPREGQRPQIRKGGAMGACHAACVPSSKHLKEPKSQPNSTLSQA
jgi:hypothetical protein